MHVHVDFDVSGVVATDETNSLHMVSTWSEVKFLGADTIGDEFLSQFDRILLAVGFVVSDIVDNEHELAAVDNGLSALVVDCSRGLAALLPVLIIF